MASTKDVLNHHLKAFEQGDLNGVLSDYGPGRRLFHKGGAAQGRRRDQALVRGLDRRVWETRGNIQHAAPSDRRRLRLYFMDSKDADNVYELSTDTFVVREGKIVCQSFTAKITPRY